MTIKKTSPEEKIEQKKPVKKIVTKSRKETPQSLKTSEKSDKKNNGSTEIDKVIRPGRPWTENVMSHRWKKWQSWNPKWRPRKTLAAVIEELKQEWYERVSQCQIMEAFELLMGLDRAKIIEITNDETKPMSLRIAWKSLLSNKWADVLEKMLDRAHGKAKQVQELQAEITTRELSPEKKEKVKSLLAKRLSSILWTDNSNQ